MKILVVEDTRTNAALLREILLRRGDDALVAETGAQALAAYDAESPDLILLDVMLPDTDGYTVAREVRKRETNRRWTPIIFLSAMTSDAHLEAGIAAGGDDYLFKPISEAVVAAKIAAMQRLVRMRDQLVETTRQLDTANRELQRLSTRDGLTGIGNRRFFDDLLTREWGRSLRNGSEIALLLCDVDYFKRYNDTYGHQTGDQCLKAVADALASAVGRTSDIVARYGGEEFVVVLPDTSVGGILFVAEKLRHGVHCLAIPHSASERGFVTISVGIASAVPTRGLTPAALIDRADRALYRAKQGGRDRVCRFDPDLDQPA
ncbi:MAG TPA: diguanylate cyclase [Rhodocyclaceae bacterium]|jgi:diguanylate cyclase (GGDEF)-like protein|nr:diguanylate cyclase [Rhodocyclaceae bacterium]HNM22825.1 diguanylate cyclase [Rhodocyclaceae bacterium]HNM79841.1 diguanylate cyclase [Rhodocyclaceae bacterium]HNP03593.1 diguanylate cyclase [Rhodocyclaceae bacterium]